MVIYTDKFIPDRFGGIIYGPIILIRPKYRDDIGLLEHEREHVRQWWRGWGVGYWLRYTFSHKWRLRYELEGYRVQLLYSPQHKSKFAYFLATNYRLTITWEEAFDLLSEG